MASLCWQHGFEASLGCGLLSTSEATDPRRPNAFEPGTIESLSEVPINSFRVLATSVDDDNSFDQMKSAAASASASYSWGFGGVSANFEVKFFEDKRFSSSSLVNTVTASKLRGSISVDLNRLQLTQVAADMLRRSIDEFFTHFGDHLLSGFLIGGTYTGFVEYKTQNSAERSELKASLAVSFTAGLGHGNLGLVVNNNLAARMAHIERRAEASGRGIVAPVVPTCEADLRAGADSLLRDGGNERLSALFVRYEIVPCITRVLLENQALHVAITAIDNHLASLLASETNRLIFAQNSLLAAANQLDRNQEAGQEAYVRAINESKLVEEKLLQARELMKSLLACRPVTAGAIQEVVYASQAMFALRQIMDLAQNALAPWMLHQSGLNFFGTCPRLNCEAHDGTVLRPGNRLTQEEGHGCGTFSLAAELPELKCLRPSCHQVINVTELRFVRCGYSIVKVPFSGARPWPEVSPEVLAEQFSLGRDEARNKIIPLAELKSVLDARGEVYITAKPLLDDEKYCPPIEAPEGKKLLENTSPIIELNSRGALDADVPVPYPAPMSTEDLYPQDPALAVERNIPDCSQPPGARFTVRARGRDEQVKFHLLRPLEAKHQGKLRLNERDEKEPDHDLENFLHYLSLLTDQGARIVAFLGLQQKGKSFIARLAFGASAASSSEEDAGAVRCTRGATLYPVVTPDGATIYILDVEGVNLSGATGELRQVDEIPEQQHAAYYNRLITVVLSVVSVAVLVFERATDEVVPFLVRFADLVGKINPDPTRRAKLCLVPNQLRDNHYNTLVRDVNIRNQGLGDDHRPRTNPWLNELLERRLFLFFQGAEHLPLRVFPVPYIQTESPLSIRRGHRALRVLSDYVCCVLAAVPATRTMPLWLTALRQSVSAVNNGDQSKMTEEEKKASFELCTSAKDQAFAAFSHRLQPQVALTPGAFVARVAIAVAKYTAKAQGVYADRLKAKLLAECVRLFDTEYRRCTQRCARHGIQCRFSVSHHAHHYCDSQVLREPCATPGCTSILSGPELCGERFHQHRTFDEPPNTETKRDCCPVQCDRHIKCDRFPDPHNVTTGLKCLRQIDHLVAYPASTPAHHGACCCSLQAVCLLHGNKPCILRGHGEATDTAASHRCEDCCGSSCAQHPNTHCVRLHSHPGDHFCNKDYGIIRCVGCTNTVSGKSCKNGDVESAYVDWWCGTCCRGFCSVSGCGNRCVGNHDHGGAHWCHGTRPDGSWPCSHKISGAGFIRGIHSHNILIHDGGEKTGGCTRVEPDWIWNASWCEEKQAFRFAYRREKFQRFLGREGDWACGVDEKHHSGWWKVSVLRADGRTALLFANYDGGKNGHMWIENNSSENANVRMSPNREGGELLWWFPA